MALTPQQSTWLNALLLAAPDLVAQVVKVLRALGHDAAADDFEVHLANADAGYREVVNQSRAARGLPPL